MQACDVASILKGHPEWPINFRPQDSLIQQTWELHRSSPCKDISIDVDTVEDIAVFATTKEGCRTLVDISTVQGINTATRLNFDFTTLIEANRFVSVTVTLKIEILNADF